MDIKDFHNIFLNCEILRERKDLPKDDQLVICLKSELSFAKEFLHSQKKRNDIVIVDYINEHFTNTKIFLYLHPRQTPWDNYTRSVSILKLKGIIKFDIYYDYDKYFKWINGARLNKNIISNNLEIISRLYYNLSDDISKNHFMRAIKSRISGDIGYYSLSDYNCYFHPKVKINKDDIIIDAGIGSYIEPTKHFSNKVGQNGKVICFEPSHKHYNKAKNNLKDFKNVSIFNIGLWNKNSKLSFIQNDNDSSHVDLTNNSSNIIDVTDLDSFLDIYKYNINFIKMDIEGAELNALRGSKNLIVRNSPNLAICIYHQPYNQIYSIYQYLYELNPRYKFFIGQHLPYFNDTVLYATTNY